MINVILTLNTRTNRNNNKKYKKQHHEHWYNRIQYRQNITLMFLILQNLQHLSFLRIFYKKFYLLPWSSTQYWFAPLYLLNFCLTRQFVQTEKKWKFIRNSCFFIRTPGDLCGLLPWAFFCWGFVFSLAQNSKLMAGN